MTTKYLYTFFLALLCATLFVVAFVFTFLFLSAVHAPIPQVVISSSSSTETFTDSPIFYALKGEKQLIETSYTNALDQKIEEDITGLLVNHHLLAGDLVANALKLVEEKSITTVLLVSPDHFSQSETFASTTTAKWETPYGILLPDLTTINKMIAHEKIQLDDEAIRAEHGIFNIIPFIKKSLPQAKVTPLIIHNSAKEEQVLTIAREVEKLLDEHTLVIASFDFAHDAFPLSAQFHDQQAQSVLEKNDTEGAYRTDIDSQSGLAFFLELMNSQNAYFHQLTRSDSSLYTNNPNQTDVTSYVTGYFSQSKNQPKDGVHLLTFGDLMMDRYIRTLQEERGNHFPFSQLGRFLSGSDITLANLEGTMTNNSSIADESETLQFTFDPSTANTLAYQGINLLSLANNHTQDFGNNGLKQTKQYLEGAGIDYFGDYFNQNEISSVQIIRDKKVAFIGYHQFQGGKDRVIQEIEAKVKDSDSVIVYSHWGAEYQKAPTTSQLQIAHEFIDAGADLVLGAHPHIVQPVEVYKGKFIAYSLGNFIFDQAQSDEVKEGLSLGISIDNDATSIFFFPYQQNQQFQPVLLSPEAAQIWRAEFAQDSINLSTDLQQQIKEGLLVLSNE